MEPTNSQQEWPEWKTKLEDKFPYHDGACPYLNPPVGETCACWHPDMRAFIESLISQVIEEIPEFGQDDNDDDKYLGNKAIKQQLRDRFLGGHNDR